MREYPAMSQVLNHLASFRSAYESGKVVIAGTNTDCRRQFGSSLNTNCEIYDFSDASVLEFIISELKTDMSFVQNLFEDVSSIKVGVYQNYNIPSSYKLPTHNVVVDKGQYPVFTFYSVSPNEAKAFFFLLDPKTSHWVTVENANRMMAPETAMFELLSIKWLKTREVPIEYVMATERDVDYHRVNNARIKHGKPPLQPVKVISLSSVKQVAIHIQNEKTKTRTGTGTPKAPHERGGFVRHFKKPLKSGPYAGQTARPVAGFKVKGGYERAPVIIVQK